MILTADYHTHTVFSHGKGTILENALVAKDRGLIELGISDHGFAHSVFGIHKNKLGQIEQLCKDATEQTGVKVLRGVEANIVSTKGKTDLTQKHYDNFDIYLCGMHKIVLYSFGTIFSLGIPNLLNSTLKRDKVSKRLVNTNTKTFINVIKNNPVDIITHLNFCCYADAVEVAKACADYGTYLELNSKKTHLTDEQLQKVLDTGVNFVIGSDAHTPDRVGEISLVTNTLQRVNIPESRIHNISGKLPVFRFKAFKEGR